MTAARNYKNILFLAICLLAFRNDPGLDYRKEFGREYTAAEELAALVRPQLTQIAKEFNEDPRLMEAIIFPELIRYNRWYDYFETGSLCVLYSRFGADYANFSVGYFQMKPGFAISLEKFMSSISNQLWVRELGLTAFPIRDDFENRMARVRRLQEPSWQLRYLVAFIKCCRLKHGLSALPNKNDELQFLAAAYNSGWELPASAIRKKASEKFFHLEQFNPSKHYIYADIALKRFHELSVFETSAP